MTRASNSRSPATGRGRLLRSVPRADPSFTAGTGWLAVSNLIGRSMGMLVALTIAAAVAPSSIGQFGLFASTAAVIGAAGLLGLPPLITRAIASTDDPEERSASARRAVLVSAGLVAGLGGGLWIYTSVSTSPIVPGLTSETALVIAIWAVGLTLNPLIIAILLGHREYIACTKLGVIRSIWVGVGTLAGGFIAGTGVGLAVGAAVGEVVTVVWGCRELLRLGAVRLVRPTRSRTGVGIFAYSALSGSASLGFQASLWLGQILLAAYDESLVSTGAFVLISRFLVLITIYPTALASTSLPTIAGMASSSPERHVMYRRMWRLGGAFTALGVLAVLLVGLVVLPLVDSTYGDFAGTFVVMAAAGSLMALNNIMGSVAVGSGHLAAWIVSDWAMAGVLLAVAVTSVASYGALGLAGAHFAAYASSVLVLAIGFLHKGGVGRSAD